MNSRLRQGTLLWLDKVATGPSKGLACYQPGDPETPTMTAEAWVCRQFLGVGGPGPASTEAADFLLRNDSDRGPSNFYYWYYATLALYQHGGEPWSNGMPRSATGSSDFNAARVTRLEAGTPMVVSTGPKEAGSIAQPWRR